jgi:hypothetical protein
MILLVVNGRGAAMPAAAERERRRRVEVRRVVTVQTAKGVQSWARRSGPRRRSQEIECRTVSRGGGPPSEMAAFSVRSETARPTTARVG